MGNKQLNAIIPAPELDTAQFSVQPEPAVKTVISQYRAGRVRRALAELYQRRLSALNLYEPLEHLKRFHEISAPERVLRGSNRSSKTFSAAIEIARAVTGQDPYNKYPKQDGRAFLVGKDGIHLSTVMYRKLFRAGAFWIIKDEKTKLWRSYRPWEAADKARESERKPAPPLIPMRYVKEIAWENKKENWPRLITMKNGWELLFFSSLGKPPHGQDLDIVWFDEEIFQPDWYAEMAARLIDRHGVFIWSATPQAGSDELFDLHEEAALQAGNKNPRVVEFYLRMDANPHLSEEDREIFASKMKSEQERKVRIEGEFALTSFRVYPEYDAGIHGCAVFPLPPDWTRYAIIDPGRQVCAVLFAAIPPPHSHDYQIFLYDELYLKGCSAAKFGEAFASRAQHQQFHAFIIDHQGSRVVDTGSGLPIEMQYSAQLKQRDIKSTATGHAFQWGNSDVQAGVSTARGLLEIGDNGMPILQVFRERMPNFENEIKRYRYKRDTSTGMPSEKPDLRHNHLMDCLRYLAMYDPKYHKPPKRGWFEMDAVKSFRAKRKRKREKEGGSYVRCG